jgi:hypothetical protein
MYAHVAVAALGGALAVHGATIDLAAGLAAVQARIDSAH